MASSTSNTPQPFNPEDFANAAAAVASQLAAGGDAAQRPLRTSQSFRMDEGYSGEETPSLYEDPNQRDDMRSARDSAELRIPAWMTGLNDALREGLFVFCRTQFLLSYIWSAIFEASSRFNLLDLQDGVWSLNLDSAE